MSRFAGTPVASAERGKASRTSSASPLAPQGNAAPSLREPGPGPAGPDFEFSRLDISHLLQRKPAIDEPGDASEREADAAANRVLGMQPPAPLQSASATVQRKCNKCED